MSHPAFSGLLMLGLVAVGGAPPSAPGLFGRPAAETRAQGPADHLANGRWLRLIATNDFHGAMESRADAGGTWRGGAVALAAAIARARAECVPPGCASLLLDGGDEFQGTAVSNLAFGRPVVALFNRLGRTASALGNHDLDWGQDTLRARMREATYAILGANVVDDAGQDVQWIPDDTIVTAGATRVGLIGIATVVTPTTTRAWSVRGLRFLPPAPVVDAHVRALRARGAERVVVLAHAGAFCDRAAASCAGEIVDLARDVTEPVDAIVSGHTHSAVTTIVHGIPIIQARVNGTALGVLDVPLDPGVAPVIALRDVLPVDGPADPVIDSLVRAVTDPIAEQVRRPIVEIAERMSEAELGNLIADAQRSAGGGDVAMMNRGGVRTSLAGGTATFGSLFEVQPFGNSLVRVTLKGATLLGVLERVVASPDPAMFLSGVVVTYDSTQPSGRRILSAVMADGQPLDVAGSYRLVLSDFLAAGGDGVQVTAGAERIEDLGIVDLDALIAWLRAQPSPVQPPRDARLIVRTP